MITLPRSPLQQCFGREDLCNAVVNSALEAGAVLLFGGRQAGKTTLLREIAKTLSAERAHLRFPQKAFADYRHQSYGPAT